MQKKSSLAVIVPCYNEESSIPAFFQELVGLEEDFLKVFPEYELYFYFIDNNSTDRSSQLLRQYQNKNRHVLTCTVQGYGAALKYGFQEAGLSPQASWLGFLDLDNTYPLQNIIEMLQKLQNENLDMVYGARIHQQSRIPFIRGAGNQFYVLLAKILFKSNLSDVCSGMRIFKKSHLEQVLKLQTNDLSFSIDLSAEALLRHWALGEVQINYRDRIGESKLSVMRDGFLFLFVLVRKYFYNRVQH